jgi:hypothetical protein
MSLQVNAGIIYVPHIPLSSITSVVRAKKFTVLEQKVHQCLPLDHIVLMIHCFPSQWRIKEVVTDENL